MERAVHRNSQRAVFAGNDEAKGRIVGKKKAGFDFDTNEVYIIDKNKKVEHIELSDKRVVADKIMENVANRLK